ncbi:hypothetical protein KDN34_15050 [Shewanella yunxiaonensis]|uniref:Uncharacterized protein n=1 Tax=Shewanella yunxiaonensis TaxID=2829809 RepID=A0ABX7YRU1_9GAMM|nr:hypothetical protein [Shewanella yunxiaonensis]QUN05490.1 hypothetical protein KDN34_15050 [Shewanella yunxiaonensis]
MKTFGFAIASVLSVVGISFVVLLLHADIGDVMFAMLSGSFAAMLMSVACVFKNIEPQKISQMMLFSIIASAATWLIATITLKITTISLFNTTALAFDLIIGMIGSIATYCYLLDEFTANKE